MKFNNLFTVTSLIIQISQSWTGAIAEGGNTYTYRSANLQPRSASSPIKNRSPSSSHSNHLISTIHENVREYCTDDVHRFCSEHKKKNQFVHDGGPDRSLFVQSPCMMTMAKSDPFVNLIMVSPSRSNSMSLIDELFPPLPLHVTVATTAATTTKPMKTFTSLRVQDSSTIGGGNNEQLLIDIPTMLDAMMLSALQISKSIILDEEEGGHMFVEKIDDSSAGGGIIRKDDTTNYSNSPPVDDVMGEVAVGDLLAKENESGDNNIHDDDGDDIFDDYFVVKESGGGEEGVEEPFDASIDTSIPQVMSKLHPIISNALPQLDFGFPIRNSRRLSDISDEERVVRGEEDIASSNNNVSSEDLFKVMLESLLDHVASVSDDSSTTMDSQQSEDHNKSTIFGYDPTLVSKKIALYGHEILHKLSEETSLAMQDITHRRRLSETTSTLLHRMPSQQQQHHALNPFAYNAIDTQNVKTNSPVLYGFDTDKCLWKAYHLHEVSYECNGALHTAETYMRSQIQRNVKANKFGLSSNDLPQEIILILMTITVVLGFSFMMYFCCCSSDGGSVYPAAYRGFTVVHDDEEAYDPDDFEESEESLPEVCTGVPFEIPVV